MVDHRIEAVRKPIGRWVAMIPRFPAWVVYGQNRKDTLVTARELYAIMLNKGMGAEVRSQVFSPSESQTPFGVNFRFGPQACG